MKIVDVAEFYSEKGGGVRTYIDAKLAAGKRHGHEIVVVAPGPDDREENRLDGKIIWVKCPRLPLDRRYYMFHSAAAVHRILDMQAPDIVEASSPWRGGWIVAQWRGSARKALFWHQEPVSAYPQAFLGRMLGKQRVDHLFQWYWRHLRRLESSFHTSIVCSDWLAARHSRFGLRSPHVIPLGVEKGLFSATRRDREVRRQLLAACGVGEAGKLVLSVGRFHPEKSIGTVIDAFARANAAQDLGLMLVGDGPLAPWVAWKAKRVESVYLAGVITDRDKLASYMASADALLHGCSSESYGLVVAEATCSGLPVVVPDDGGAKDLARPEYAEIYKSGDSRAAAAALLRLLDRDRETVSALCAQMAAEQVGSRDDHFRILFAHYKSLLARPAVTVEHRDDLLTRP